MNGKCKSKKVLAALCASTLAVVICLPTVLAANFRVDWNVTGTGTGQAFSEVRNESRYYQLAVAVEEKSSLRLYDYKYKYINGVDARLYTDGKYYSMSLYNPWGNFQV